MINKTNILRIHYTILLSNGKIIQNIFSIMKEEFITTITNQKLIFCVYTLVTAQTEICT